MLQGAQDLLEILKYGDSRSLVPSSKGLLERCRYLELESF